MARMSGSSRTFETWFFFFLNAPPTTEISPLPLHAALPIYQGEDLAQRGVAVGVGAPRHGDERGELGVAQRGEDRRDPGEDEREHDRGPRIDGGHRAGEHEDTEIGEHTSELQSQSNLVCRLLL